MEALSALTKNQKGQLLIEILLAMALTAIILPALLTGLLSSAQGKAQQVQRAQATALLKEAEEAVRNIKERSWADFAVNGTHHPVILSNEWSLASGDENVDGLTRSVTISDVSRDSNGVIVTSGGTPDPSTKRVYSRVSWGLPYLTHVESTMYLTRYGENGTLLQTTVADFTPGTLNDTIVANNNGGEIELGSGSGAGNWCSPSLSLTTVNLSRQGVPTAVSATEINGDVSLITGTGGNASGPTFVNTLLTGDPPTPSTEGEFDNSKSNGVFVVGTRGYIATDSNSEEVKVLDLTQYSNPPTNTKFEQIGAVDAPANTDGTSVFVSGSFGYMTALDKFYIFDTSDFSIENPTGLTLAGVGNKVVVIGNYAYVAVNSTTTPLQILDISNPLAPSIAGSASISNKPGIDVAVNGSGTRAYLVTPYVSSASSNVLIIDTSTKTGTRPTIGSGYNTNGMNPKGVSIATGNRLIVVGTGGSRQYQVINTSDENNPTVCGTGLTITNGANAVSTVLKSNGFAYSYVVTGDANAELKIVLGGSGGSFSDTGTFTSQFFDAGNSAAFNYFIPTFIEPIGTSIRFKVAVAQPVNNNCNDPTYTFVGPDGTTNTYFEDAGAIPFSTTGTYSNPGRCFKYFAELSTNDFASSPILYDVTVNYSP